MTAIPSMLHSVLSPTATDPRGMMNRPNPQKLAETQQAEVADAFESVFISLLIKQMRETTGEEGLFAGDNSDTFGGMFDMFMGQHLAKSSNIGIDKMIMDSFARTAEDG